MGCTNATESGEPSKTHSSKNVHVQGTMNRQKFKELDDLDRQRISLILDYWYDEGPRDGGGGNSKNYHEEMVKIRKES